MGTRTKCAALLQPRQIVVCLSFVDLVLGAFFLFSGLWILLDWKIHELWVWLPFVIIGGLLMFTTFLRCGYSRISHAFASRACNLVPLSLDTRMLIARVWRAAYAAHAPANTSAAA